MGARRSTLSLTHHTDVTDRKPVPERFTFDDRTVLITGGTGSFGKRFVGPGCPWR
jgi:FlaA1/EpsC-like NDP-sugar epimerase